MIPAHDEAETIGETLEGLASMLEREEIDHEVIVVDDGSTDETAAVVAQVGERHPGVRCLRSPNQRRLRPRRARRASTSSRAMRSR